jgi:hypothetical protein
MGHLADARSLRKAYSSIQTVKVRCGLPRPLEFLMKKLALAGIVAPIWFTAPVIEKRPEPVHPRTTTAQRDAALGSSS